MISKLADADAVVHLQDLLHNERLAVLQEVFYGASVDSCVWRTHHRR